MGHLPSKQNLGYRKLVFFSHLQHVDIVIAYGPQKCCLGM